MLSSQTCQTATYFKGLILLKMNLITSFLITQKKHRFGSHYYKLRSTHVLGHHWRIEKLFKLTSCFVFVPSKWSVSRWAYITSPQLAPNNPSTMSKITSDYPYYIICQIALNNSEIWVIKKLWRGGQWIALKHPAYYI